MTPGLLVRQLVFRDVMSRQVPRPDDGIRARRLVQFPCGPAAVRRRALPPSEAPASAGDAATRGRAPLRLRLATLERGGGRALAPVARAHLAQWRGREPGGHEPHPSSQTRRREDHRGDGTAFRHAALPDGVTPSLLPQSHGALQKAAEGIDFAAAIATGRALGAFLAVCRTEACPCPTWCPASERVRVEVLDGEQAVCRAHDAESKRLVTAATLVRDGERLAVDIPLRDPGT